jgi:hypothetical protein
MGINSSVNHSYHPHHKNFGPLSFISIITFLTLICQINSASQANRGPDFGDDSDSFEAYRNATAGKREASSDILKIEVIIELVYQKIQSFGNEELLTSFMT